MSKDAFSFVVRWNNYASNFITELESLRMDGVLFDCTLLCEDGKFSAHKLVLSTCSSYFRKVFKESSCKHPVVILKDVCRADIEDILCFAYQGCVYVPRSRMQSFLKTAESLQIKGLTEAGTMMSEEDSENVEKLPEVTASHTLPPPPSSAESDITKRKRPLPSLTSVTSNLLNQESFSSVSLDGIKRKHISHEDNSDLHITDSCIIQDRIETDDETQINDFDRPEDHNSGGGGDYLSTSDGETPGSHNDVFIRRKTGKRRKKIATGGDQFEETSDEETSVNEIQESAQRIDSIQSPDPRIDLIQRTDFHIKEEPPQDMNISTFNSSDLFGERCPSQPPSTAIPPTVPVSRLTDPSRTIPTTTDETSASSPDLTSQTDPTSSSSPAMVSSYSDTDQNGSSIPSDAQETDRLGKRPCPLCMKIISNKSNLLKHIRIRHNSDFVDQATCPQCYKTFKNKYSLRAHINIYHKESSNTQSINQEYTVQEEQFAGYSTMIATTVMEPNVTMPAPTQPLVTNIGNYLGMKFI